MRKYEFNYNICHVIAHTGKKSDAPEGKKTKLK